MAHRLLKPCCLSLRGSTNVARYHDYTRVAFQGGTIRVPLNSPKLIGVVNSRGNRSHQEDFYGFATLSLDPEELRLSVKRAHGIDWNPDKVGGALARQVLFVGVYDGHGGSAVAQFLRQELHGLFESVDKKVIPELFKWIKEIGGYFKRFRGGALAPWVEPGNSEEMTLDARATLAFFEVDKTLSADPVAQTCGATASVAILHSLDAPSSPFYCAKQLSLTVAHCGSVTLHFAAYDPRVRLTFLETCLRDTRVILCSTDGGRVFAMTENHHADAHVESIRLRRMMGSSLMTDSFGESRWMGALANTRCLGDLRFKRFGVTPEPEVRTKLLNGDEWAFVVLVSDGISSVLSDDEIVDLARDAPDPKAAAERILAFSEELGGDDNATAIVVPLAGWAKVQGPDKTKDLREYRRRQAVGTERQRRM